MKRILIAALAAFALSGCDQLRVESIPTGEVVACDRDLTGWWQSFPEKDAEDTDGDDAVVYISDDCSDWVSFESLQDAVPKQESMLGEMKFDQRIVGGERYLAITELPKQGEDSSTPSEGITLLRYRRDGDRLTFYTGNTRREAHRIADALVSGRVETKSRNDCRSEDKGPCRSALDVLILGDGNDIANWLTRFEPLDEPLAHLVRAEKIIVDRLSPLLIEAPTDGKPKPHE
jgi:hypothetical protein